MKTHETHAMRYWKKCSSHQSASYRSLLESFASYNDFWSLPLLVPALSYNCKTYLWLVWYKTLLTTFALSFHLSKIVWNCNNYKGKMNYNYLFSLPVSHHSTVFFCLQGLLERKLSPKVSSTKVFFSFSLLFLSSSYPLLYYHTHDILYI